MENLDYVLERMEDRTPDNFQPSSLSRGRSSTYSTRTLLNSYQDKRRRGCCSCQIVGTIIIIILIAWGVAVPLYFLIGPGVSLHHDKLPQVMAQAQRVKNHENSFLNGTVLNAINGTVRIVNQRFTPNLANHFSAEYQALKLKLETLLSVVFNKKSDFNKAAVIGFRPGSVVVQFVLIFNKNQLKVRHLVHTTLTRYLGSHWSMLGTFQIDIGSVDIRNVKNQCAIDNGGCSHLCFWSILSSGYECRCPIHYRLLNDGKTCFPSELPKEATTPNPCSEDQYLCRSRNCIPSRWLCDGVSDCLLGEDEASHMCESTARRPSYRRNVTSSAGVRGHMIKPLLTRLHLNEILTDPVRKPTSVNTAEIETGRGEVGAGRGEVGAGRGEAEVRPAPDATMTSPSTSHPVILLQRRPTEADVTPPSLVKQSQLKPDSSKARSFSFFG